MLVLGEAGSGKRQLAQAVYDHFQGKMDCAMAIYKGSGKRFFQTIAEQLDVPTEVEDDNGKVKALTMDSLKEEIAINCGPETLLIFPEAKRLTTGVRYWLEDLLDAGVRICCFAVVNPGRDIFLDLIEFELSLPSDKKIREVMKHEAVKQGLDLSREKLAALQPLAGRNPMLARKVIRNEALGLNQKAKPEHSQYLDISPIIISSLMAFGIVRFIGMGTGNKGLYIFGGISLIAAMMFKQLGQIRGAKKRRGQ